MKALLLTLALLFSGCASMDENMRRAVNDVLDAVAHKRGW